MWVLRGIALQFKHAFPANYKAYEAACKKKAVVPGSMFVYATGTLTPPRFIINFPTKRHWRGKSSLKDIENGLDDLARVIQEREITSIAIPPLGCGLGGLDWPTVMTVIEQRLAGLRDVRIVLFEPNGAPHRVHPKIVPRCRTDGIGALDTAAPDRPDD